MPSEQAQASGINAADENPPSRPGPITSIAFLIIIGGILLYMNWKSFKGLLGFD